MSQSIITNETKGSPINAADVNSNFKLIALLLAAAGIMPKDYEPLTGSTWNLSLGSNFKKLQLTQDTQLFTEGGVETGIYVLDVMQPANGGKKLTIDNKVIPLHKLDSTKVFIAVGAYGKDYDSNVSLSQLAPRILSQSKSQTVIQGDLVRFYLRGEDIKKVFVYKDGDVIEEKESPSFQFRMSAETEGMYQFRVENEYGFAWSDEMSAEMGEAEAVYVLAEPVDITVNAGETAGVQADFGGTPTPLVKWQKQLNGIWSDIPGATGEGYSFVAVDTTTILRAVGTNSYKVTLEADPVTDEDTNQELIQPATTQVRKTFAAQSREVTVKAIKQDQEAPVVTMNDALPISTLAATIPAGHTAADMEGSLDVTVPFPATVPLTNDGLLIVGDIGLAANKAGIRYRESLLRYASPWATNQKEFTTFLKPFTQFVANANWSITGNKLTVTSADAPITSEVLLPKILGANVEATVNYNQTAVSPFLILDTTTELKNGFANQKFGLYGYQGRAQHLINGNTLDGGGITLVNGDKLRFEIVEDGGTLRLAFRVFSNNAWATITTVDYPTPLYIKALGSSTPGDYITVTGSGL